MGNQQGQNCFTSTIPNPTHFSDIIPKEKERIRQKQKDLKKHLEIPVKIMGLPQSYPVSSAIQNNDGIITIKLKIQIKGNQEQNYQSQNSFHRNPIKVQIKKTIPQKFANSTQHETKNNLRQTQDTISQENVQNILEIDLPQTSTRKGSCQIETLSQ